MEPALDTLNRLLASGPALHADDWSLADEALAVVLARIGDSPVTVAECGSGRSTIVIARRLAELGAGRVDSLEHDPAWAQATRAALAAEGLDAVATVHLAPLEPHRLAGERGAWYSAAIAAKLPDSIELLLIDGPPAGEPELERSRHPALAELGPRLAAGAAIVVDDATRAGETAAIASWQRDFGLDFRRDEASATATAIWPVYVAQPRTKPIDGE